MAAFRRALTKGGTYFFTVATHRRRPLLTQPAFYAALKDALGTVKQSHPFQIDAFVLLPDHLHCIWTLPEGDASYSLRWNIIKRLVTQATRHNAATELSASRQRRGESGLWQRRFWEHQIRDEGDFEKHVEYIHWNPVKHGYVAKVADWPYSSFHGYVARGVFPADWGGTAEAGTGANFGEPL